MSKTGQLIKQIAGTSDEGVHVCKVLTVEGATCNVEPLNGLAELHGVRLNCVTSSTAGIIITPKINSEVIVHQISKVDSYVAQFSEIEKINVEIGAFKFSLNGSEMVFNDGNNGGLIILQSLITDLGKYSSVLTALKAALDVFVPQGTPADGGALALALKTAMASYQTPTFQTIEDTKIKH